MTGGFKMQIWVFQGSRNKYYLLVVITDQIFFFNGSHKGQVPSAWICRDECCFTFYSTGDTFTLNKASDWLQTLYFQIFVFCQFSFSL